MTIDFTKHAKDLFTTVFFVVRAALRSGKRFFLNYGGAGSSKSVSQHQSELINLLTCDYDILFMRKVAADIYDSSYKLFENLARQWNIYDRFEWTYSQGKRQILNKKTGHRILFRGADDISKLKSIVGIGRIVLEEADAFEFEDFKEINRRARGFENIQIVFILNPVDEDHWIKKMFFDPLDTDKKYPGSGIYHDRTFINRSTYHNNQFLTAEDIAELEAMKKVDEYDYEVYVLAQWGRIRTGMEFYPHFKITEHVGEVSFIPHLPVHLTYDFNAVPYTTCLASQLVETDDEMILQVFAEYCLESPLNSGEATTQAFVDDHERWLADIFYYGDASGTHRIPGQGDHRNFDDIRTVLHRWIDDASDRVSRANKPIMKRRSLVNKCLSGNLYLGSKKIRIVFDDSCVETIKDFRYLKLGKNGKLKEEVKHPKTGEKYQKYGHTSDAFEYEFCEMFSELM